MVCCWKGMENLQCLHSHFKLYFIKHCYLFQQVTSILVAVVFGIIVHTVTEEGSLDPKCLTNFIHKKIYFLYNTQICDTLSFRHLVFSCMFIPCILDVKRTCDSITTLVLMLYIGYIGHNP